MRVTITAPNAPNAPNLPIPVYNCVASIQTTTDVSAVSVVLRTRKKGTIPMYNCVTSIQTATNVAADECGLAKKGIFLNCSVFIQTTTEWLRKLKHRRVK